MRNFIEHETMPTATQQQGRRRVIAKLLERHTIHQQAELVELLRAEGYEAPAGDDDRDWRGPARRSDTGSHRLAGSGRNGLGRRYDFRRNERRGAAEPPGDAAARRLER